RDGAAALDDADGIDAVLGVFLRVCDAVAFAHSRGGVHGDIKPDNIMVGAYGEAYMMDWGIATLAVTPGLDQERAVSVSAERYVPTGIRGTPAYMAPEQALGNTHALSERTDVFGLGSVLYFILTGEPPFDAPTNKESLVRARACLYRDPEETPRGKRMPALCRIARRAMAVSPDQRHPSVMELQREVRLFLRGGSHFPARAFAAGQAIVREGEPG